ncbi:GlcG/HbpS family heme-binding protein [Oscillospiraceae bacterium LTW-04]|nr:heme-binding protein [Oscillospiraceae bacterium MB24-C1]
MINRITHAQFTALCSHVASKIETEKGKPVVIVIADEAGEIVHMLHMDNTPARSGIIASGKAFTAAKMERTTTALGKLCEDMKTPVSAFLIEGLTTLPGGTPIFDKNGTFIGAVGISGRSAVEDQALADACAAFLGTL